MANEEQARGQSPSATGPAGAHFEGQVGAYYFLSLLNNIEPRGLRGTVTDRIEFQRAGAGHPLDDITVRAHEPSGRPAVIEIQVKRKIVFSPADPEFRDVVHQIAKASQRADFWTTNHQLAVAIARSSHKIDGPYQDVLKWAHHVESAAFFFAQLRRKGTASNDMRSFVDTFRSHLQEALGSADEVLTWRLLQRTQILVFDFSGEGSQSAELARDRAARLLHDDDQSQAASLWSTLIERAIELASVSGARTRRELQEELRLSSFRLAGDRRYGTARAALVEASEAALAAINDRVGNVTLLRPARLGVLRAALDQGRYVEIRGDAGVGKSVLLKHLATQLSLESTVLVLSPGRTTPRGWLAFRATLGFDGSARDLLSDLASTGGATLFIDNLDFFPDDERHTVSDLVRAAASMPGFSVVATARRRFEAENPNWLPQDALSRLGRAKPVTLDELDETEVSELSDAAPELALLLDQSHPAHEVARNLFRLDRLVRLTIHKGEGTPVVRTEIDMAEQWWQTADGPNDTTLRDRARLLRRLAEDALRGVEVFDVSGAPSEAVDALVGSRTLRDFGQDRVAFQHDVLSEWAIGALLWSDSNALDFLPLSQPASARQARGIELAARRALERNTGTEAWEALLAHVSTPESHGSWRRSVLLAVARSEDGVALLTRLSGVLSHGGVTLLRELIRTVMAVDVTPLSDILTAAGMNAATVPIDVHVPRGLSWLRLIVWLLSLGDDLPRRAIPEVVDLYTDWSVGRLGQDKLTPLLLPRLHGWLIEIEQARYSDDPWNRPAPLGGEVAQLDTLEASIRHGFLLFCDKAPDLAASYLNALMARPHNEEAVRSILKFRGTLAKAAPAELAELTATALIPQPAEVERWRREGVMAGPFNFIDHNFIPASPAQGPFYELLAQAPQHGLVLIRRLVDHAIAFHTGGKDPEVDSFVISLPEGDRAFPWMQSYNWSREGGGEPSIASGLMALEAWAHARIERGDSWDAVIDDILGTPGAPGCYLLVAVDLLLSHWPASATAAVPFLACPALLCIDRQRHIHDQMGIPDIFGLKELQKEPAGAATLEDLRKRPSRRFTLDRLLAQYAVSQPAPLRDTLTNSLKGACERLGTPKPDDDLGDPRLMAVHALNLVNPANYQSVTKEHEDGRQSTGWQYIPPESERQHFRGLQERASPRTASASMQAALSLALEDPSRSSAELANAAVAWAQDTAAPTDDKDESWMYQQALVAAAMVAMRDGDDTFRTTCHQWAAGVFADALADETRTTRDGLRFNPGAIAFVGMVHALHARREHDDLQRLLDAAFRPSAVQGFIAAASTLAAIDERLPRALLRCGLSGAIYWIRQWNDPDAEATAAAARRSRQLATVSAELAWLSGQGTEPAWPELPAEQPPPRRRIWIGRPPEEVPDTVQEQEYRFSDQVGARWLQGAAVLSNYTERRWILDMLTALADWTYGANGAGLDASEEASSLPYEWNRAYFGLLAGYLPGQTVSAIDVDVLQRIHSLPDDSFFHVGADFLRSVDEVYFNNIGLDETVAITIRLSMVQRLATSNSWHWTTQRRESGIGMHIAPIIATCFFNTDDHFRPPRSYLFAKGIDRLSPFLPILEQLAVGAPIHFVAAVVLNLLEVSPRAEHLTFLVNVASNWQRVRSDSRDFWIEHGFGQRVCALLEAIRAADPRQLAVDPMRSEVSRLLASLVQTGVAEATRLERKLFTNDVPPAQDFPATEE